MCANNFIIALKQSRFGLNTNVIRISLNNINQHFEALYSAFPTVENNILFSKFRDRFDELGKVLEELFLTYDKAHHCRDLDTG